MRSNLYCFGTHVLQLLNGDCNNTSITITYENNTTRNEISENECHFFLLSSSFTSS